MEKNSEQPEFIDELLTRLKRDQELLHRDKDSNGTDTEALAEWEAHRSENIKFVMGLTKKHGFIGRQKYGSQAYSAAWVLVQHGTTEDIPMMEEYLELLRAQPEDDRSIQHIALLTDKILVRKGLKQRYGTQFRIDRETGKRYLGIPLEDPDNVDKLRAEMGLGPLEEYLNPA